MKNLRNKNQPPNADIVQQYLESSWDIVTAIYLNLPLLTALGEAVANGDIDDFLAETDIDTIAKLNAIVLDADLGDFASQAEAEAGLSTTKTMSPLRVAQAIAALSENLQNDYNASGAPGVNDDSSQGWAAGSVWIDTTANPDEAYRCSSPSVGAAVWLKTTLTSDELALVALTGDSDDLIEGVTKLLMTVAERAKLGGIEAGATGDMTAAEIKSAYESNADTNAFTDALLTKLNSVESGADITDTANVTAAGALMDSEVINLAAVKAFNPADYATAAQGALAATAAQPSSIYGKNTLYIPAGSMRPSVTGGCAPLVGIASAANQPDIVTLDFDATTEEYAQFSVPMPKQWNEGTVTFQVFWSSTATGTTGIAWGLQGVCVGDNSAIAVAYGTAVVITDDAQSNANEIYVTAESTAITLAGTPAVNKIAYFRIFRKVSDANDDMTQDARLHGIKLFYTTDALNDA